MNTIRSIRMALMLITTTAAIALAGCTSDVVDDSDVAEEAVGETSQAVYDATNRMQCYYRTTSPYDLICRRDDTPCGANASCDYYGVQWKYTFSTGQTSSSYYTSWNEVNWGNCTFSGTKATTKSVDVKALWNGLETSLQMYCE